MPASPTIGRQELIAGLFSDPEIRRIHGRFFETSRLTLTDHLTIGDIATITGYHNPEFHLLLLALFSALRDGHTTLMLDRESLSSILSAGMGEIPENMISELIASIADYPRAIGGEVDQKIFATPVIFEEFPRPRISLHRYHVIEKELALSFKELMAYDPVIEEKKLFPLLHEILVKRPIRPGKNDKPDLYQAAAVLVPFLHRVSIISGGPGTGKSTIVLQMLRLFLHGGYAPDEIAVASPTGRAAGRLSETIRQNLSGIADADLFDASASAIPAMTLHRLLGYSRMSGTFSASRFSPIPYRLVVVDEVSMVDLELMHQLLLSVKSGTRLVFIGDGNQLPPVQAGAILTKLIPDHEGTSLDSETLAVINPVLKKLSAMELPVSPASGIFVPTVVLKNSYRSGAEITAFANRIISGETGIAETLQILNPDLRTVSGKNHKKYSVIENFPEPGTAGAWLISSDQTDQTALITTWIFRNLIRDDKLVHLIEACSGENQSEENFSASVKNLHELLFSTMILSPLRKGPWGSETINEFIMGKFRHLFDFCEDQLCSGMPIIIESNDYANGLFNGDLGVVLQGKNGLFAAFPRDGNFTRLPVSVLTDYKPAFAMTIHKSQGSEFNDVLLLWPDEESDHLTARLLYTAATRAKKSVYLYGKADGLASTLANNRRRMAGFSL